MPHGGWRTVTLVHAIDMHGTRAAMTLEGALDGDAFVAFCEQVLAPTLNRGDVVVVDNLRVHYTPAAVRAIEKAGARVEYLPPYSPDLNPIENVFAKVKELMNAAFARTVGAIHDATGAVLDLIDPSDCKNAFRHCGYRVT